MPNFTMKLSHIGLQTSDLEASIAWYTKVLGLTEAFRLERDGRTSLIYLHLTRDTFIELFAPRGEGEPLQRSHFSIEVDDIEAAVARVKPHLAPEAMSRPEPILGGDGSMLFNFFDPDGHRIEFQQFVPESQEARAIARYEAGA